VIPQLEPLSGDFNELASVVGPEPADVIEATRKQTRECPTTGHAAAASGGSTRRCPKS
jgi:hypothetical protein